MPILSLWRPSQAEELRYKEESSRRQLNYAPVGATRRAQDMEELRQKGWIIDRTRVQVGRGAQAFEAARGVLGRWGHFQLGWAAVDPDTGTAEGAPLTVTAKTLFLWTCNPLRIVYSRETEGPRPRPRFYLPLPFLPRPQRAPSPPRSFSFAQGCLEGHMLMGEEAFGVEMKEDGTVWYNINTFSKPVHPLAVVFFPILRYYQGRFAHDSARAITAGVAATCATRP